MASKMYKKARKLAMLPEDIKQLVEEKPRKARLSIRFAQLEGALTIKYNFEIEIVRPGPTSQLTDWKGTTPPMTKDDWKEINKQLYDMFNYTQMMGIVQAYNLEDIRLLFKAVMKDFLWNTTIELQSEE